MHRVLEILDPRLLAMHTELVVVDLTAAAQEVVVTIITALTPVLAVDPSVLTKVSLCSM